MAEEPEQAEPSPRTEDGGISQKKGKLISWYIVAGIVLSCALAGLLLGRTLVITYQPEAFEAWEVEVAVQSQSTPEEPDENTDTGKTWFFNLEPVVANLDEPGGSRYVRMALTLEVFDTLNESKGEELMNEKQPYLRDWLSIYMASLSLDDARGERNLKRIQAHVLEAFNQILFPNAKPHINKILLNDFSIQ